MRSFRRAVSWISFGNLFDRKPFQIFSVSLSPKDLIIQLRETLLTSKISVFDGTARTQRLNEYNSNGEKDASLEKLSQFAVEFPIFNLISA